ncbi:MAG: DUF1653 domain-containing protein [Patescibacteria group bacterium]
MTFILPEPPHAGEVFRHYKGGIYAVICVVQHTETEEALVIYQRMSTGDRWAKPLSMWYGMVEVPGGLVSRFTLLPEDLTVPVPLICKVQRSGTYSVVPEAAPPDRIPDGTAGVRDVNAPCADFRPGKPDGVFCAGDGHYLCRECAELDLRAIPEDERW